MFIVNMTQHPATAEQLEAGVMDLPADMRERLTAALTFSSLPEEGDLAYSAAKVCDLFEDFCLDHLGEDFCPEDWKDLPRAMLAGAPWMMPALEWEFHSRNIDIMYPFSQREVAEEMMSDGSVRKSSVFRHVGFIESLCTVHAHRRMDEMS